MDVEYRQLGDDGLAPGAVVVVLARAGERLDADGPATGAEQVVELECEAGVVRCNI